MRRFCSLFVVLVSALFPSAVQAHFLWATLDPSGKVARIGLQEHPGDEPLPLGDRADRVKARTNGKFSTLKADSNWLKASITDGCFGASLDYGVLDRRDGGRGPFWLNYYAKAASTTSTGEAKIGLAVELTLTRRNGKLVVTVLKGGKPIADADVVVELPDGSESLKAKSGADGTVSLPDSTGPVAVRALVTENRKGSHDGKSYDLIRSYSTLTVSGSSNLKPLMSLLRESFGDNHDTVGHTAFVDTLMSDKLTKTQLEAHLQQRALIHTEVDKVLAAASNEKRLPYGDDQKNVVVLLRKDLETMGSSWPAESQAWPLTKGLIDEIRASAIKGPYFALGVLHVYYGGITHGGRDIGAKIDSTLKINLTYYLKSDGYGQYARKVDLITDAESQSEMIRGGQAAYRYIIAVNDSEVFKSN